MKNFKILLLLVAIFGITKAQVIENISITGVNLSQKPMVNASSGVAFINFDATQGVTLQAGEMITIEICGENIEWTDMPSGAGANYFTWQESTMLSGCLIGTCNTNIPQLSGGMIFIPYDVVASSNFNSPGNGFNIELFAHANDPLFDADDFASVFTYTTSTDPCVGANISANGVVLAESGLELADGAISINPNGGQAPYNVLWNGGSSNSNNSIDNLQPGAYEVLILDNNGCAFLEEFVVAAFSCDNVVMLTDYTVENVNCFNGTDGSIEVLGTEGGVSDYTYVWPATGAEVSSLDNLAAGDYLLQVKDKNLCEQNILITVDQPDVIEILTEVTNASSALNADGSITLNVFGGTAPYVYNWLTVQNNEGASANSLLSGDYTIEVVDANGCSRIEAITVGKEEDVLNGVANVLNFSFAVYPNPNSGLFSIEFVSNNVTKYDVKFYDVIGKLVLQDLVEVKGKLVKDYNFSSFSSGLYFIEISNGTDSITKKVVIETK